MGAEKSQSSFWRDVVGVAKDVHAQMKAEEEAKAKAAHDEASRRAAIREAAQAVIDGLWPSSKPIPPVVAQEVRRMRTVEREQELQQAYQQGVQAGYQRGLAEGRSQAAPVFDPQQEKVDRMHAKNIEREYYAKTSWLDRKLDRM